MMSFTRITLSSALLFFSPLPFFAFGGATVQLEAIA